MKADAANATGAAKTNGRLVPYLLLLALLVAAALSLLASASPDGLEHVASQLGFMDLATEPAPGLMSGYQLRGASSPLLAQALAGIAGVLVVLVLAWGVGLLLKFTRPKS